MRRLRPIIDVRELPPNAAGLRANLPGMRSLVSEQPHPDEARVIQYLQQGVFGCWYPDPRMAWDVLAPGTRVERQPRPETLGAASAQVPAAVEPGAVLTDGVWLWPGVLSYYVERYHLRLPPDFVEHARANGWTVPASEVRLEGLSFDAFGAPSLPVEVPAAGGAE